MTAKCKQMQMDMDTITANKSETVHVWQDKSLNNKQLNPESLAEVLPRLFIMQEIYVYDLHITHKPDLFHTW